MEQQQKKLQKIIEPIAPEYGRLMEQQQQQQITKIIEPMPLNMED